MSATSDVLARVAALMAEDFLDGLDVLTALDCATSDPRLRDAATRAILDGFRAENAHAHDEAGEPELRLYAYGYLNGHDKTIAVVRKVGRQLLEQPQPERHLHPVT